MTNILAFDLATNTGWVAGDGARVPEIGHFRLPATGSDVGRFLCEGRTYFKILIARFQPDMIGFEMPIMGMVMTPAVSRKLHGLAGVLEMCCRDHGIECREVPPATAKKRLTGSGRAKKPAMILAARRLGLPVETEDEADGAAVWLVMIEHYSENWPAWAERLKRADDGLLP